MKMMFNYLTTVQVARRPGRQQEGSTAEIELPLATRQAFIYRDVVASAYVLLSFHADRIVSKRTHTSPPTTVS